MGASTAFGQLDDLCEKQLCTTSKYVHSQKVDEISPNSGCQQGCGILENSRYGWDPTMNRAKLELENDSSMKGTLIEEE
jgi:hypothetical protein